MNESKIIIGFALLIFNGFGYVGALNSNNSSIVAAILHACGMIGAIYYIAINN